MVWLLRTLKGWVFSQELPPTDAQQHLLRKLTEGQAGMNEEGPAQACLAPSFATVDKQVNGCDQVGTAFVPHCLQIYFREKESPQL